MAKRDTKFSSIIITHYHKDEERSDMMMTSLTSLIENTDFPFELTVIDNGNSDADSDFLMQLTKQGKINTYIRNANNMHFGYARNQGFMMSDGDYIVIADNDIRYKPGWLTKCVKVLEQFPSKKIYATPIYNVAHHSEKYWKGEPLEVNGEEYRLNRRAGSNCFVMRRDDYVRVGLFRAHRIAGTKWTERAWRSGYWSAVTPEVMVEDLGFRKGYNFQKSISIKKDLGDGTKIYFNDDDFKKENRDKLYRKQKLRCYI